MKMLFVNQRIMVSIFSVILLIYGVQGISYAQGDAPSDAPTVVPGENNTSLIVWFSGVCNEGRNAYQVQLRRKSPQGEWTTKCVIVFRSSRSHTLFIGFGGGGCGGDRGVFGDLEPGVTYEARYRDTNQSECIENPPAPDLWSEIGEGSTRLVGLPRVDFVDANLAKAVRWELRLNTHSGLVDLLRIPKAELAKLTELDSSEKGVIDLAGSEKGVIDLTGLEHATQLITLNLEDNQISDLTPLAQLTQLTELDLSGNQISDITPLAQLTQLTELDLSGNQISDITPLAQLTQLTELNLENNEITDLTPLAQLTQLSSLLLRGNPIGYPITDTSPLVQLLRENPKLDISIDIPIFTTAPGGGPDLYLISDDSIQRVSLVKTNVQYIVSELRLPRGIALDVAGGKIYWGDSGIQRANLDGTNVENVVSADAEYAEYIALDVADGKIYWTNWLYNKIQRANLDGTNVQDIVTGLESPEYIALDVAGGKIYWTDWWTGKIQRANLDGTNVQDIVTGLRFPYGIALDVAGGKIYWTDRLTGKIQRANLDGTNVQDIVTGLESPEYIALDVAGGKMYWTEKKEWEDDNDEEWYTYWEDDNDEEWYTYKIQRANLDGTNVEDVVVGLTDIEDIALSSTARDIPDSETIHSDSRNAFESSMLSRYTRVTLSDAGRRVDGVPTKYTDGSHLGTVAYMLLAKLKGCNFATAELARQSKVYIKTQALGRLGNFASETVCGVTSREYTSYWDGVRITHLRFFDESSSPNIQEAIYNAATGQYELTSITHVVVSVSPASVVSPAVGEQLTFSLNITGGESVAGYQATVQFDTTALRYVSGTNGDFLPAGASFVELTVEGNLIKPNAASVVGESNGDGTLATLTFEVVAVQASTLMLSAVLISNTAGETFVPRIENAEITGPTIFVLEGDVNGDGTVNNLDLLTTISSIGNTGQDPADINGDGIVDIADFMLVAGAIGNGTAAPSLHPQILELFTAADVKLWLSHARQLNLTDPTSLKGILFLEQLLAALLPRETALLPNFPNPFNPETWIPYHLAKASDVQITIYDARGVVVRLLDLGHQRAGYYTDRSRAAYWDGRNEFGERVATGIYFYQLQADNMSFLRKMVILK